MRVISVCSWKGGVGKTTTAQHLGYCLSKLGKKTLLVDLDPMHGLSTASGVRSPVRTITDLFEGKARLEEAVVEAPAGFPLVPADTALAGVERALQEEVAREQFVKDFLRGAPYEIAILDTPPSLGILTLNAFAASDGVLITTDSKFLSLEGLAMVFESITKVQRKINPALQVLGVVPTMFTRTVHARECVQEAATFLHARIGRRAVFPPVPHTVKFSEASTAGQTVFQYAPDYDAARPYEEIAREVLRWATDGSLYEAAWMRSSEATGAATEPTPQAPQPAVA